MMIGATLACVLTATTWAASESAPAESPTSPAQWLSAVVQPNGLEALRSRGYIVVQGKPGAYRLQAVSWKALETLPGNAKAVQELAQAWPRLKAGEAVADPGPLSFMPLSDLPPGGIVTPPIHALISAIASYHGHWTALTKSQEEPSAAREGDPDRNLFDQRWGEAFASRTGADLAADVSSLVKPFFDQVLAGVRPEPEAAAHFVSHEKERHKNDVSARLEADVRAGSASEELKAALRRYLDDQRHLHAIALIKRQVADLEKKTSLIKDMADLEAVAAALREHPTLISEIESLIQVAASKSPASGPELTTSGLHLEKPLKLEQHELGDEITVSGVYWIDGLRTGQTVEIEETSFRETPEGFRDVLAHTVKRGNGGPYIVSRSFILEDSRPFTFRSIISAEAGKPISDSISVGPAKDFELGLLKLAAADNQALGCSFAEAESAYAKLEESLSDAAREKPQYQKLLETARQRHAAAAKNAALLTKLDEIMGQASGDSSEDRCRYDLQRTEAAAALARALPAGCDPRLGKLRRERAIISRRAADQEAFRSGCARASARRRACDFDGAAEEWSRALAILDSDPAARCGNIAQEAGQAESDLRAVNGERQWRKSFAEELKAAEGEPPAESLRRLHGTIARVGTLERPACFSAELEKAEDMGKAAGAALVLPDSLIARFTADESAGAVVSTVANRRQQLLKQAEALRGQQAAQEAPAVPKVTISSGPASAVQPSPAKTRKPAKAAAPKQAKSAGKKR
jgi:hypothetical protein